MPKVQPLRYLIIGEEKYLVEELSETVQKLIDIYNEWNQDLADARNRAMQLQAAVQVAQNEINNQLEIEAKDQRANDDAAVDDGVDEDDIAPPLNAKAQAEALASLENSKAGASETLPDPTSEDRFKGPSAL